MAIPYKEGDRFAIPLRDGGYAVGVVARSPKGGKVLLGYFFGPRYGEIPAASTVTNLSSDEAIKVVRFGDISLLRGEWPIVYRPAKWNREDWPMPSFVRTELPDSRAWRVVYHDNDPNRVMSESRLESDPAVFERDAVFGAGAIELLLTKLL